MPEMGSRRLDGRLGTFPGVVGYVRVGRGGTMGIEPEDRRLIVKVLAFVVVCVVIGGVWPWLIR